MTMTHCPAAEGCPGTVRHGPALHGLSDAGEWVLSTLREWRRRHRDRSELAALDDRALRDIGLTRADAVFLSSKPFWKE